MAAEEFVYEMSTPRDVNRQDNSKINDNHNDKNSLLNPMETFYHILIDKADRKEKVYLGNLKNKMKGFSGFVLN